MSSFSVFYSWQHDLPRKYTRDVIRNAANIAMGLIGVEATVDDAPRLDEALDNVAGLADISGTIFQKIDSCGVFLADVTFTGENSKRRENEKSKLLPNSNVMIELGYALARLGDSRIILVMNTHFGVANELMFHLKHRRFPISFALNPDDDKSTVEKVTASLSEEIRKAILLTMQSDHYAASEALSRLDRNGLEFLHIYGKSSFFSLPPANNYGELVRFIARDTTLLRLLDLNLLHCDIAPERNEYSYQWTYKGKLALRKLGIDK